MLAHSMYQLDYPFRGSRNGTEIQYTDFQSVSSRYKFYGTQFRPCIGFFHIFMYFTLR